MPEFTARNDSQYIKYSPHPDDSSAYLSRITEYGIDEEDEKWLQEMQLEEIDEDDLERMIDYLEKESIRQREFRQVVIHTNLSEEDVPCCVCDERDYDEANLIIFCDGCNIPIHQVCQGLAVIPENDWYCDVCAYMNENQLLQNEFSHLDVACALCEKNGGVFKRTSRGRFVHIVCALMIPETYFDVYSNVDIDNVDPERARLVCSICNERGTCMQCNVKTCFASFHPICAQRNGHLLKFFYEEPVDTSEKKRKKEVASAFHGLCLQHSAIQRSKELEDLRINSNNVKVEIGRFIDKSTLKEVRQVLNKKLSKDTFDRVCEYWKEKRYKIKNGRMPLIYQLNIAIEFEKGEFDAGYRLDKRPRKEEILLNQFTPEEKLERMRKVRLEFEKARLILDMLRKREILKCQRVKLLDEALKCMPVNKKVEALPQDMEDSSIESMSIESVLMENMSLEDVPLTPVQGRVESEPTISALKTRSPATPLHHDNGIKKQTLLSNYFKIST